MLTEITTHDDGSPAAVKFIAETDEDHAKLLEMIHPPEAAEAKPPVDPVQM